MNDTVQIWSGILEYDEIKIIDGCSDHGKISYVDGIEDDSFECEAETVIEVLDKLKLHIISNGIPVDRIYSISLLCDCEESGLVS